MVLVVIAGYLVWLRSKVVPVSPQPENTVEEVTPSPIATMSASPSATPSGKEATGSTKQKTSTSSSTKR